MLNSTIRRIAVNETLNKWFHSVLAVKFLIDLTLNSA